MNKYHKIALMTLAFLALIASAFYLPRAIMIHSGYCLSEERYLSPQEKINIAVSNIISSVVYQVYVTDYKLNVTGDKIESKRVVTSFPYSDLEEFYTLNPDCCFFFNEYTYGGLGTRSMPLQRRLQGRYNPPYLYINYIVAFDWENNNAPIYGWNYYTFTNCGRLSVNPDIDDFFCDRIFD